MHSVFMALALVVCATGGVVNAQTGGDREAGNRLTSLEADIAKLKSTQVSGYLQTEWQQFDQTTNGRGRALLFDARRNLFTIRRGRIKIQHRLAGSMGATLQIDLTERGVVIKDAFLSTNITSSDKENDLIITAGAFNRPNFEVEYSSSQRESPERAQITRAFYPDERDLGIMATFRKKVTENFVPQLQLGLFNGSGLMSESDSYKDVIARLSVPLPLDPKGHIRGAIGGSFYYGGIPQLTDSIQISRDGTTFLVPNDDRGTSAPGTGNRRNVNIEAQFAVDVFSCGPTIIRGEFMTGKRPTAAIAPVARDTTRFVAAAPGAPFQIRNQSGYYVYLVQDLGSGVLVAAKMDGFDRNTDLAGMEVTSIGDAASTVIGVGAHYTFEHIRLTLWYELPTFATDENIERNGSVVNDALRSTDMKDNKLTIRFQYRF